MSLLIFGRSGQVAQELARALALRDQSAVILGRDAVDLRDTAAVAHAIRQHAPSAVINAAAWTAVDKAESEEDEANLVNGAAPAAMAQACADLDLPLVHISTDYVFDGQGTRPWTPKDQTAPINAYGRSKRLGETAILEAGARAVILRTSWVFSAHGANFVKTMLRLSQSHAQLRVVADQIGAPTPARAIAESCLQIAEALRQGARGGLHHFAGDEDTSWACFARETFARAKRATLVEDIPTSAYPTPAARPLNSRLDCAQLASDFAIKRPDWKSALAEVISELEGA